MSIARSLDPVVQHDAERIRDKIEASKSKGMWMGGVPPIGYRPEGRSLQVVEEHAKLVRHLYDR